MASLQDKVAAAVAKAFAKVGRVGVVLRTYPAASADVVAGTTARGAPTDVALRSTPILEYSQRTVDGEAVRQGDCYVLVEGASSPAPEAMRDQEVVADGKTWRVVNVRTHSAGTAAATHELQLRGSA